MLPWMGDIPNKSWGANPEDAPSFSFKKIISKNCFNEFNLR